MAQLRKAQAWVLDLFFGFLVFVLALTIFFKSEINLSDADERNFGDVVFEARQLSDSLMRSGSPSSWTSDTVIEIGITDSYRVNMTKVGFLNTMDYGSTKTKLRLRFDYYVYFESAAGVLPVAGNEGLGKPGVNSTNIVSVERPTYLVRMNRFVIFNSQPARMVVLLWD